MTATHKLNIEGHKLVAQLLNPEVKGEPIFLIHGITASINFWSSDQIPIFLGQGPTYLLTLPGHYPAALPPQFPQAAITPEMIARVLTTAIQQLVGRQQVTLVGHSTGGFAALSAAIHAPELVRRVVSISGFAQGKWTGALGLSQNLLRYGNLGQLLFKIGHKTGRCHRRLFRACWRIHLANTQALSTYPYLDPLIDKFYPDYRRLDLDAMVKYFRVMPQIDITAYLANIMAPTLVLTGDQDPTVPPTQAHLIAAKVPKAELAVIRGGGHFLFMECPTEYETILRNWLAKTGL